MKYTIKTKKIGDSLWIRIPSDTREMIDLSKDGNELVEVEIVKNITVENNLPDTNFRCNLCNYNFDANRNNDDIYCPLCGNDNHKTLVEVEKVEEEIIENK